MFAGVLFAVAFFSLASGQATRVFVGGGSTASIAYQESFVPTFTLTASPWNGFSEGRDVTFSVEEFMWLAVGLPSAWSNFSIAASANGIDWTGVEGSGSACSNPTSAKYGGRKIPYFLRYSL